MAPRSQESASEGETEKRALQFFALEFREARPMVAERAVSLYIVVGCGMREVAKVSPHLRLWILL